MKSFRKELWFETPTRRAFINITRQVQDCLSESAVQEGLALVNAMHITASVFINDDESGLHTDYEKWLEALAPHVRNFVNADDIALQLGSEHSAMAAGRIMLERLRDFTDQRANVAFESTLASRSFAPWIRRLKDSGYSFNLFYFWLPTPDVAIERVRVRKLLGGHSVPEVDIRRRYRRGLQNFFDIYRPLATAWEFYDNTQSDPRLIAAGDPETVEDAALWAKIETEAIRGDSE